jgi:hypothetical protein
MQYSTTEDNYNELDFFDKVEIRIERMNFKIVFLRGGGAPVLGLPASS